MSTRHFSIAWPHKPVFADGKEFPVSATFIERLCRSYKKQVQDFAGFGNSFWSAIREKNGRVHDALINSNHSEVARIAQDPFSTNICYGFESFVGESINVFRNNPDIVSDQVFSICDNIIRLRECLCAGPMLYPEAGPVQNLPDLDEALASIEQTLGTSIPFPNPFRNEFGVATKERGIVSYRAIQALYQAIRINDIAPRKNAPIVEIGGGFGRTAFYARHLGLTDYTLIDLPLTTIAQAIFFNATLGEDSLTLPGEEHRRGSIAIETPSWFHQERRRFSLAVNIDSMVEMDETHARQYIDVIQRSCGALLSINHEFNGFRVTDLIDKPNKVYRFPYWMRAGYAEELYNVPDTRLLSLRRILERIDFSGKLLNRLP